MKSLSLRKGCETRPCSADPTVTERSNLRRMLPIYPGRPRGVQNTALVPLIISDKDSSAALYEVDPPPNFPSTAMVTTFCDDRTFPLPASKSIAPTQTEDSLRVHDATTSVMCCNSSFLLQIQQILTKLIVYNI